MAAGLQYARAERTSAADCRGTRLRLDKREFRYWATRCGGPRLKVGCPLGLGPEK
jgi:hypothetical protein